MAKAVLDPRIEAVRAKYDLSGDDFWELPQKKGAWLVKHAALEVVAVRAGIIFDDPVIIEADTANGVAALSVAGSMYERVSDKEARELRREWATGEASPKNNRNAYPWAMAEKRAKDRVTLKLVGIHGLVYSEDEMSDAEDTTLPKAKSRDLYKEMQDEIDACGTVEDLQRLWRSKQFQEEHAKLKDDWKQNIIERFNERIEALTPQTRAYSAPTFDNMERAE